jgi:hypothetical protein
MYLHVDDLEYERLEQQWLTLKQEVQRGFEALSRTWPDVIAQKPSGQPVPPGSTAGR